MATKFVSALTGPEMDQALTDMAYHNSEAYAVGTRNGVAVGSSDVTYHNNSKYWAEQVYGYTDRAEDAANRAEAAVPSGTAGAVFFDRAQTLTTAQQEQVKANISAGSTNPNLLDNPFFTINQRDVAVGVNVNSNGFVADRWQATGASGAKRNSDGSITITNTMFHKIATTVPVGKTVTISALYADGTIEHDTFTWTGTTTRYLGSLNAVCYTAATPQQINFTTATKNVSALKLELGSVSTLANDAPPNYAEELAKCQYYFRRVQGDVYLCSGMVINATSVVFPFPFTMYKNPVVTMSGNIVAASLGGLITMTAVQSVGRATNAIQVRFTTSGATAYSAALLTPQNGGYIDFSADL